MKERLASTLQYGGIGRCSADVVKHLVCVLEEKGLIRGSLLDQDTGQLLLLCYSSSAMLVQTQDFINRTSH